MNAPVISIMEQELARLDDPYAEWKAEIDDHYCDLRAMIHDEPPELDFFIKDRVLAGRGFLVTGLGGSSKSRMLFHLALGAATGRLPWDWGVCKRGKAVLFMTEDTKRDVHRTIYHMVRAMHYTDKEIELVAENVKIHALAGEHFKMLVMHGNELFRSSVFDNCVRLVREHGNVQFVGLDPALSLTQGEELNQGHQRMLGQLCDHFGVQTGAACGMVSHAAKGIGSKEELDSHNSRGGGAITDAVRAEITMRSMTIEEARRAGLDDIDDRHNYVQVAVTKANHLPPSAKKSLWLTRVDGGTLLAADGLEFSERAVMRTGSLDPCFEVLKELCRTAVPKVKVWRDQCFEKGLVRSADNDAARVKAFQRVIDGLKQLGLIKSGIGYGTYIPEEME